jgi:hypothetical protein
VTNATPDDALPPAPFPSASRRTPHAPHAPVETLVRAVDAQLRRREGLIEYTTSHHCLLRVGLARAPRTVPLSEGVTVPAGAWIVALHFWNEQIPKAKGSADLAWAKRFSAQLKHSLAELAVRIETDPALEQAVALRGRFPVSGARKAAEAQRFGARFGFEIPPSPPPSAIGRAHDLAEDFWLWGLAWAFNPASLRRRALFRRRDDLWMSRERLMARYGPASRGRA